MSKNHRGSGIRSLANHGRGVCGICGKADIKVLYEHEVNGQATNICKLCKAALKNKARIEARKAVKEAPVEEAPAEETEAPAEA